MTHARGFTLIDLLLSITTLGLLLGVALPSMSDLIARYSANAHAQSIWRTLAKTRETAILSGERATFCGVDEHNRCVRDDIKAFMIFHDRDKNRELSSDETAIDRVDFDYPGEISLRASNQRQISFADTGYALQFGSIVLCHRSLKSAYTRRVTVNRAGRAYVTKEPLDSNGQPIVCN
jgi:type IV fimbrial biogenesis protein FimT